MKLFFPHFKELSTNKKLKDKHFEIVRAMMCEKLISINNNPELTKDLIEEHLHLEKEETSFSISEKKDDFITVTFKFNLFELFDCEFELPIYIHYDEKGRQNNYTSYYTGNSRESTLIKHLNLNNFNNENDELSFYLQKDFKGAAYSIKKKNWIILLHLRKVTHMTYFFDKDHKICRKSFELRNLGANKGELQGASYSVNADSNIETELMLLRYTKHILNEKQEVDSSFFNSENLNLEDTYWFKVINTSFYDNWNGDNKVAFMDYLKLIEMMEI